MTGPVRVIRGPKEFDQLQAGEILVAPLTAPAWTPLFTRAAGVGCGEATARLLTGMRVTVDGSTGNVEPG